MALSVLVALVLTPPLCATLLRPPKHVEKGHEDDDIQVKCLLSGFNRGFQVFSHRYQGAVKRIIKSPIAFMAFYGCIIAAVVGLAMTLPTSFLPDEDQGALMTQVQLPVGATTDKTVAVLKQVQKIYQNDPAVDYVFTIAGFGSSGSGENQGMAFVRMKEFKYRASDDMKVFALVDRVNKQFAKIHNARVFPMIPPAVRELGNSSGFDLQLKDVSGVGHDTLSDARDQLIAMSAKEPLLSNVRANGQDDTPQLKLDIDNTRAGAMGVSVASINSLLGTALGGTYVNDFIDRGRIKRVYVQGDAEFRSQPQDINRWFLKNTSGDMVPFSTFGSSRWTYGAPQLQRYNGASSMEIQGTAATGESNGKAMEKIEELAGKLPSGVGYEWT
eukprot:gene29614-38190_t